MKQIKVMLLNNYEVRNYANTTVKKCQMQLKHQLKTNINFMISIM